LRQEVERSGSLLIVLAVFNGAVCVFSLCLWAALTKMSVASAAGLVLASNSDIVGRGAHAAEWAGTHRFALLAVAIALNVLLIRLSHRRRTAMLLGGFGAFVALYYARLFLSVSSSLLGPY